MSEDLDQLQRACTSLGIVALYLHGSRATGHARPDSDLDVAFLAQHGQDTGPVEDALLPLLASTFEIDEADVDLQNLRLAPPPFRIRVFDYGRLLYCGQTTELARFRAGSLSESWDYEYFMRPFREAMRSRIREGRYAS